MFEFPEHRTLRPISLGGGSRDQIYIYATMSTLCMQKPADRTTHVLRSMMNASAYSASTIPCAFIYIYIIMYTLDTRSKRTGAHPLPPLSIRQYQPVCMCVCVCVCVWVVCALLHLLLTGHAHHLLHHRECARTHIMLN